jgi:hypothetical protein
MSSGVLLTYFSVRQAMVLTSSPYSTLLVSGCTFLSSGVLLTSFSIQDSLGLISSPYSVGIFVSGCTFMSSGVLLTYFSIQPSLGLTSSPYSIPTLLFRRHFNEPRRASHLLQHPAVPGPYFFALFYTLLFRLHFHELQRASHLHYSSIQRPLGLSSVRLILYSSFQATLS